MKLKDTLQLIAWEWVNPVLLKRTKRKHYHFNGTYAGINLGCGLDNPGNWLGIDGGVYVVMHNMPTPVLRLLYRFTTVKKNLSADEYLKKIRGTKILHHDLNYGIPFDDNSVPAIYSSHFFEHLSRNDTAKLLAECLRVTKPGGIIRICVPSIDHEIQKMKDAIDRYDHGDIVPVQRFMTSEFVGYNNIYNNHRWMYNFAEMRAALESVGFVDVVERTFAQGELPDVRKLETLGGVIAEARKSTAVE